MLRSWRSSRSTAGITQIAATAWRGVDAAPREAGRDSLRLMAVRSGGVRDNVRVVVAICARPPRSSRAKIHLRSGVASRGGRVRNGSRGVVRRAGCSHARVNVFQGSNSYKGNRTRAATALRRLTADVGGAEATAVAHASEPDAHCSMSCTRCAEVRMRRRPAEAGSPSEGSSGEWRATGRCGAASRVAAVARYNGPHAWRRR